MQNSPSTQRQMSRSGMASHGPSIVIPQKVKADCPARMLPSTPGNEAAGVDVLQEATHAHTCSGPRNRL